MNMYQLRRGTTTTSSFLLVLHRAPLPRLWWQGCLHINAEIRTLEICFESCTSTALELIFLWRLGGGLVPAELSHDTYP